MKKYETILFDLDGTLINTEKGILTCMKHTASVFNINTDNIDFRQYIGPGLLSSFTELLGNASKAEDAVDVYRSHLEKIKFSLDSLYDGIYEMLEKLKIKGYTLVITTAKLERFAKMSLTYFKIDHFFDHVFGATIDDIRTEKEDIIEYAIKTQDIDKDSALIIGDRKHDLEAADEIGIDAVGVLYGFGTEEEISKYDTVFTAKTVKELENFLVSIE